VIDKLYQHLCDHPAGAESETLLALIFESSGGTPEFGRELLSGLLAGDPRFVCNRTGTHWSLADEHVLDASIGAADFVVVDLETTGQRPEEAGITEIGAVRLCAGAEIDRYETLVNPCKPIPPYVATLTGISDAMVATAPRIEDVMPAFVAFAAGAVLVAHNAAFDVAVLDRAARRVLGRPMGLPSLCTFKLARRLLPDVTKASLDGLAAHYGLAKASRHRALADAELTAAILIRLMRILEGEGVQSVAAMLAAQEDPASPRNLHIRIPRASLEALPHAPGVFWLLDADGQALFVGQADDLRARVVAYFTERSHLSQRQYEMASSAADVGSLCADGALERSLLEAREIQLRAPMFNRVDRHLPRGSFVKLQRRGRFSRVLVASRISSDGALYLGPIKSRTLADDAVALIAKTFGLRTCAGSLHPAPDVEPCWLGPAGWCSSPCNAAVSAAAYQQQVEEAVRMLAGDPGVLRNANARAQRERDAEAKSRDGAIVGRLAKLHRRRHWLVNAHNYVVAFAATGGGIWIAVVIAGTCRKVECVGTVAELTGALDEAIRAHPKRRVGHFEADASTILAHWIRRPAADESMVIVDLDADLTTAVRAATDELAPLVA
jgi:DNA polymerase III subunit epsilon